MKIRMTRVLIIILVASIFICTGCGGRVPASPIDTFKTYVKALKAKDLTTVKLLLSNETMKMHEQEAKAQGVTVDDIVKRDTLVREGQTTVEFKNEKIDGDRATLEVKNSFGSWDIIQFVREGGEWKIDKKGFVDNIMRDVEDKMRDLDTTISNPTPVAEPTVSQPMTITATPPTVQTPSPEATSEERE